MTVLNPYASDRVSLAREARVQEMEQLERRAASASWWARQFEAAAGAAGLDAKLSSALFAFRDAFDERVADLHREIGQ